ncbi:ABC-type transport system involved in resistance to organic solvents, permease component [Bernardetia litoralis DSM 6794]|uniref:ABC-type transport system involved in resistance to organic solvents, permease component n=1 Tax=Bernardetia litoralis (strain ATCC 23117 / DSM 6794 / NBRC 15988 / NCIMB 1366 / Fx l1 / Sio-4) TaxID=880071 RepID=I4ANN8_BERLS|nr:ABC transporter permease [Bernardetia litoralis]AFM05573.1 ABC-type transport system involved in resistance to organic solvents, permease component [Bernardetia litoralis DSM 6794]
MKSIGKYMIFLSRTVTDMEPWHVYVRLFIDECMRIGISSVYIVTIISTFIGAVTAVQTAYNLVSPLIPKSLIGTIVRDMTVLELAPTITAIVFAGKVGSNIAGGLGTMRITEQIDAIEVMGINATSYLVFPKILAGLVTYPLLVIMAAFLAITGGYLAATLTGQVTAVEYVYGIRLDFVEFNVFFMLIKSVVFAFLVTSISAYMGYYTRGGALEVGESSTKAVTTSCIAILLSDYLLAQLLV